MSDINGSNVDKVADIFWRFALLTHQELFDYVARHLLTQGKQSQQPALSTHGSVGGYHCAYRGANGTSCAVGCLIPDNLYFEDIEGASVMALRRKAMDLGRDIPDPLDSRRMYALLTRLQNVHDCEHPRKWPEALETVAMEYDLEFPEDLLS